MIISYGRTTIGKISLSYKGKKQPPEVFYEKIYP